jgi:hypothetical protein
MLSYLVDRTTAFYIPSSVDSSHTQDTLMASKPDGSLKNVAGSKILHYLGCIWIPDPIVVLN